MSSNISQRQGLAWTLLFSCWVLVTASVLGSLFFSEVMSLPPCSLCWYQRILMFPLVLVLLVGLLTGDDKCANYGLPLACGGWIVAAYHTLLHMGIVPESAAPCQQGVSCSQEYLSLFGFLSIPLMSLLSFSAIVAILVVLKQLKKRTL